VNRWFYCLIVLMGIVVGARRCPAPIIFRPGEGWTYEPVGQTGKWERNRAKDQLQVAQESFDKKDYRTALKAARRVVKVWPLSDHAGPAQYLLGRCYEERKQDEKAFKEYQRVLQKYPKIPNYSEILQREMAIANRFLGGQWFKLWGYIPFFPSMDKTAGLFDQIVRNGPFHETGPAAQMAIGAARDKQKNYPMAVKAYERAADRYYDKPTVAADALYKAGTAWQKQSQKAEYDQSAADRAIDTFNQFKAEFRSDKRIPDATQTILDLKIEQARGAFEKGRYYERREKYQGALVYYNEVLVKDPASPFAEKARKRIEYLRPLAAEQAKQREQAEKDRREAVRKAAQKLAAPTPAK
jgi:outer membrane protein assembly factor BamD